MESVLGESILLEEMLFDEAPYLYTRRILAA